METIVELSRLMRANEEYPYSVTLNTTTHPVSTITISTSESFAMAQTAKDEVAETIFGGTANAANYPTLLKSFCTMLHMSKDVSNIPKNSIASDIMTRLSSACNANRDTNVTVSMARGTDNRPGGKCTDTGDTDNNDTGPTLDLTSKKKRAGRGPAKQQKGKSPKKKASKKGPKKRPPNKTKVIADPCWQAKETIEVRALTEQDGEEFEVMHTWGERHCVVESLNEALRGYMNRPEHIGTKLLYAHAELEKLTSRTFQ